MNPYEILGVKEDATIEEISEVFRKLAKKYHPDAAKTEKEKKENESKFILITQAYNTLKRRNINIHRYNEKNEVDYVSIAINKAKRLMNAKDYNSAIRILSGIGHKNNDEATMLLGDAYFKKGRYHEALKHFRILYDKKPWDIRIKLRMADVYEKIGLKNTAKKIYKDVLSLDSGNERALARLQELNKKSSFSFSDLFKKG